MSPVSRLRPGAIATTSSPASGSCMSCRGRPSSARWPRWRECSPGGQLLLLDSLQRQDLPEARRERGERVYRFFARYFNEPYYLAYQSLDVPALLQENGLVVKRIEPWFRSKLWVAEKPSQPTV